jgi:hypothetical protein
MLRDRADALTGYCTFCCMIVDLDALGCLHRHGRRYLPGEPTRWCDGTGQAPAPTPAETEIAAAAFTEERRPAKCPRCNNPDAITEGDGGRLYMRGHQAPEDLNRPDAPMCPGSWMHPTYRF